MNRSKSLLAISAFSLLILGLPAIASAQWNGGGYGGNNGGYNGSGYNIRSTVKNLKNGAKNFEKATDRYDDRRDDRDDRRGGYGYNDSDNLENLADQFSKATDRLEDKYGNGRNLNNSADEARRVLDIASQIDRTIYNSRGRNIQGQWNSMRQDLNVIANTYGYNNNNRNNRNNRNSRNGDWRNRVPFPLPF
ncbi:MAG: hypothetical protein H7070_03235 [Saprospiraceae bacterium]|nr:hypothetical protein [Pyrinomonadaceae bacterium]